jgi:hypothetical protein
MHEILVNVVCHHPRYNLNYLTGQVQHNEVIKVPVEINVVVFISKEHLPSQDIVLDDNALDPRNECHLITSHLFCVVIKKVSGSCIEIICLRKRVLKQRLKQRVV